MAECNCMLNEADKESLESKILADDHKESCVKDIQEIGLNNVTESLVNNIEKATTSTDSKTQNEDTATATSLTAQNEDISSQATSKENAPLNNLAEKVSKERELDKRVMDILLAIGISANLHGYYFLKDSIKLAISSPVFIGAITKTMYPTIATMHQTTAFRVERAMRHAIDVSYNKGKIPCLNQIFSLDIFSPYDKPTNAEFIALIADKLKQEFCC